MRGKGGFASCQASHLGITPAYAGKSGTAARRSFWRQDHPRLCGEKDDKPLRVPSMTGSPPPMRGKDDAISGFFGVSGITPAYAGKSQRIRV